MSIVSILSKGSYIYDVHLEGEWGGLAKTGRFWMGGGEGVSPDKDVLFCIFVSYVFILFSFSHESQAPCLQRCSISLISSNSSFAFTYALGDPYRIN